jgi:hypothetical protein
MKTIKAQRVIAAVLVLSGAYYALFVWMLPPLWIGYAIWVGWIAVALGYKRWQEKWFWIVSTLWNSILLLLLRAEDDRIGGGSGFGKRYAQGHLVLAVLLSAYLIATVPWDTWPENRKA